MLKKLDHPPHFFDKGMQAQALIYLRTPKTYHMEGTMTTFSYIYVAESQFKSVRWKRGATTKGICLIWSRGRLLPPSLSCRGQGIGKQPETISSRHKRSTGRNLVVNRHGTALRQSVQEVPLSAVFFLSFSAILS